LDLIQKSELDITKIALAQVTDQFLVYVRKNENAVPTHLRIKVIASKLVQIKSEAMLPRPPLRDLMKKTSEKPCQQLRIYREIKNTTACSIRGSIKTCALTCMFQDPILSSSTGPHRH
jgi:segregation and condensation protein A